MVIPIAVECLGDYKLLITFSNGEKNYIMRRMIYIKVF